MELQVYITGFMEVIADDPRHLSLFLAILHFSYMQNSIDTVSVFSRELRKQVKICSVRNYYSCMKDLKEFGYIKYVPSFSPSEASSIYLVKP